MVKEFESVTHQEGKMHEKKWCGDNFANQQLANGVYICEIVAKSDGKEERKYRKIAIYGGTLIK